MKGILNKKTTVHTIECQWYNIDNLKYAFVDTIRGILDFIDENKLAFDTQTPEMQELGKDEYIEQMGNGYFHHMISEMHLGKISDDAAVKAFEDSMRWMCNHLFSRCKIGDDGLEHTTSIVPSFKYKPDKNIVKITLAFTEITANLDYIGRIKSKREAKTFIATYSFIQSAGYYLTGYFDTFPFLKRYVTTDEACLDPYFDGEPTDYLREDPIPLCLDDNLFKDDEIRNLLIDAQRWPMDWKIGKPISADEFLKSRVEKTALY